MILQTWLLANQNTLLQQQNRKIDIQSHLIKGQRRASLNIELSAIMDKITELKNPSSQAPTDSASAEKVIRSNEDKVPDEPHPQDLKLGAVLEARIVAISRGFRPYRILEPTTDSGELRLSLPVSPERGQLLVSMVDSNVNMKQIAKSGDFSFSELNAIVMNQTYLRLINLADARLESARFIDSQQFPEGGELP